MVRDKLRSLDYFDKAIKHSEDFIAEEVDYLKNTKPLKPLAAMKTSAGLFSDAIEKLTYKYSRGDDIKNLKQDLIDILEYRKLQLHYADTLPKEEAKHRVEWERMSFSTYKKILCWLSFAVNAGMSPEYFKNIFPIVDNEGQDAIFDQIAIKLGSPERTVATKVLYEKPYGLLLEAMHSHQKTQKMIKFLDSWYPACAKNGFYETHDITNNFGYAGYWCFEAALVVKLFGIDDSEFRDHRYYPADLVHTR